MAETDKVFRQPSRNLSSIKSKMDRLVVAGTLNEGNDMTGQPIPVGVLPYFHTVVAEPELTQEIFKFQRLATHKH